MIHEQEQACFEATSPAEAVAFLRKVGAEFLDLRFTDTMGREQHMTLFMDVVDEALFQEGKAFDGSSIRGWKHINCSDMLLMPQISLLKKDPFYKDLTYFVRCDVYDPETMQPYDRDPRAIAKRAEAFLQSSGIADCCYIGPEPEFFIFDDVRWQVTMSHVSFTVDSKEAAWNSGKNYPEGNYGHRPGIKGGYFPVPPIDSSQDLRSAMTKTLKTLGHVIEVHHHEVATGNQNEIGVRYDSLVRKADQLQELKYVVRNVAQAYGKTATFMPKPLVGDNGSGMHCHISLNRNGENLFAGDGYAGLSPLAMSFIAGILKHARSLNAFTNPSTNSYKRLIPGYEAPVCLTYSSANRSAAIRIPYVASPKAKRIEVRFPDASANPYLAFSAIMLAGLDGVLHELKPDKPMDADLYAMEKDALHDIPLVCSSLNQALQSLQEDHGYLLAGGVFSADFIRRFIELKQEEVDRLRLTTHPIEFDMYFSD